MPTTLLKVESNLYESAIFAKQFMNSFSIVWVFPQSKYPVLHYGTFGGTGFLFLGRLGSRANKEKKGSGPIMSNFLGWFLHVHVQFYMTLGASNLCCKFSGRF